MDELVVLNAKPGGYMESQSGLQRSNPRIYGRLIGTSKRDLAFVIAHPTSNFFGHYLGEPLAKRNATLLALNTRYVGNDSMLLMERAVQDLGLGVSYLRRQGYRRVVLIGNSGGGSLSALYQEQAAANTITSTPDGRPFVLEPEDVPTADGLALVAAHIGRAEQLLSKIDPSVLSETVPDEIDPALDMFELCNGPPYNLEWLGHYRVAQERRLRRITDCVVERLKVLSEHRLPEAADEAFIIARTQADPRNLDLTIDENDRTCGTLGGEARAYNLAANGLARFCTLRSFLSQWSPWHTRAHGPRCLAAVRIPILVVDHTADQTVFPSQVAAWRVAAGPDAEYLPLKGGTHYLSGQQKLIDRLSDSLIDWARAL